MQISDLDLLSKESMMQFYSELQEMTPEDLVQNYLQLDASTNKTDLEKLLERIDAALAVEEISEDNSSTLTQFKNAISKKILILIFDTVCPITEPPSDALHTYFRGMHLENNFNPKTAELSLLIINARLKTMSLVTRAGLLFNEKKQFNATALQRILMRYLEKMSAEKTALSKDKITCLTDFWENVLYALQNTDAFYTELRRMDSDIVYLLMSHSETFLRLMLIDKIMPISQTSSRMNQTTEFEPFLIHIINLIEPTSHLNYIYQWKDWISVLTNVINHLKNNGADTIVKRILNHNAPNTLLFKYFTNYYGFQQKSPDYGQYNATSSELFEAIGDNAIYPLVLHPSTNALAINPFTLMSLLGRNPVLFFQQLESYSIPDYKKMMVKIRGFIVDIWKMGPTTTFAIEHMAQVLQNISTIDGHDIWLQPKVMDYAMQTDYYGMCFEESSQNKFNTLDNDKNRTNFGLGLIHLSIASNIEKTLKSYRNTTSVTAIRETITAYLNSIYPHATSDQKIKLLRGINDVLARLPALRSSIASDTELCVMLATKLLDVKLTDRGSAFITFHFTDENLYNSNVPYNPSNSAQVSFNANYYVSDDNPRQWQNMKINGFEALRAIGDGNGHRGTFANALQDAEIKHRRSTTQTPSEPLEPNTVTGYLNNQHASTGGHLNLFKWTSTTRQEIEAAVVAEKWTPKCGRKITADATGSADVHMDRKMPTNNTVAAIMPSDSLFSSHKPQNNTEETNEVKIDITESKSDSKTVKHLTELFNTASAAHNTSAQVPTGGLPVFGMTKGSNAAKNNT